MKFFNTIIGVNKMDEKFKKIIANNYSSRMNTTKWSEVVSVLTSSSEYNPSVSIKFLFDKVNSGLYSPVWWKEIECLGFENIEWLKINPIKKTYIGRLVADREEDFSNFIKKGLDKYGIPYEMENEIFVIYGYYKNK